MIKDIKQYEKEQLEKELKIQEEKKKQEQIPIKTSKGDYYCGNPGCTKKTYNPNENEEGSCQ